MSPYRPQVPAPAPESVRRAVVPLGLAATLAYVGWLVVGSHPYPPGGVIATIGMAIGTLMLISNSTTWLVLWRSAFVGGVAAGLDVAVTCAMVGVHPVHSQVLIALAMFVVLTSRSRSDAARGLVLWMFVMLVGVPLGPTRGRELWAYCFAVSALGLLSWYAGVIWHSVRTSWQSALELQRANVGEQAALIDVVERSGLLLARVDEEGRPASGKARWDMWLGLSVPTQQGGSSPSLWDLYSEASRVALVETLIPEALERGVSRGRLVLNEDAGGRELDATLVLLEDGTIGTIQVDVTQQAIAEAARDRFVNTVSHELRTPLTAVGSTLDLLDRGIGGDLPAQAHGLIGIARSNTERLVRLVNQLLDLQKLRTRRLTQQLRPSRLEELVSVAVDGIEATAVEGGVVLEVEVESDLPPVMVDEDRIIQVVTNLLSNAIRHSPRGGVVRVAVTRRGKALLTCTVADDGPGVPGDAAERIFEAFEQANASGTQGGTGLGLAISRAIMEEHGGTLGLLRDGAPGAMFCLTLPVERETAAPSEDLRPWVLMVEDEELVGRALARLLIHEGYRVDLVRRLDDARSFLVANLVDVLVVDVVLPDGLGHDLIDWLAVSRRHVPVVVMSGARAEAADSRVFRHLHKPFQARELVQAVRGAARQDRAARAAVVGVAGETLSRVVDALVTVGITIRQQVPTLADLPLDSEAELVVVVPTSTLIDVAAQVEPHRRGRLSSASLLVVGGDEPSPDAKLLRLGRGVRLPADADRHAIRAAAQELVTLDSD